jgi:hypothetical protein
MEPESSSLYPQVPATYPFPEPTPSSPHNPLQLPEAPSYTVITLFNVGNDLLCVICQLNVTVFMCITRKSRYITLYTAFGIIRGFT